MDRRTFLGLGAGTALFLAGCSQPGGGGAQAPSGDATNASLRFTWWGNDTRNKLTNEAIAAYTNANPGVTIAPEPGEWSGYWDKLATQVAARDAPDIIQMDEKYIAEYGNRGALLDLEKAGVDTSKFAAGTVDTGRLPKGLFGINAGVNAPILVANPEVFAKAGVELPDDQTWTWDDFEEIGLEITNKIGQQGVYGAGNMFGQDGLLKAFVRQLGGQQWTHEGKIGWEDDMLVKQFTHMMNMVNAKSMMQPAELAEEETKPLDQSAMAQGRLGMTYIWSNQIKAMDNASGVDMALLRPPSTSGSSKGWLWYKASMYWSASGQSKNPAAAAAFIDWLSNSKEAVNIIMAERGLPPNLETRAEIASTLDASDTKVKNYLEAIESEVVDAGGITPVGGSPFQTNLTRHTQDILFGRASIPDAIKALRTETEAAIKS